MDDERTKSVYLCKDTQVLVSRIRVQVDNREKLEISHCAGSHELLHIITETYMECLQVREALRPYTFGIWSFKFICINIKTLQLRVSPDKLVEDSVVLLADVSHSSQSKSFQTGPMTMPENLCRIEISWVPGE
jgi:hypothetical protein